MFFALARMIAWSTLLVAASLLSVVPARAQGATVDSGIVTGRLAALARVWGTAKYLHPSLATRAPAEWDSALVAAIPRVRNARTTADFRDAVQSMLDVLGDPVTRVAATVAPVPSGTAGRRAVGYRWTGDRILLVTAGSYYSLYGAAAFTALGQAADSMLAARAVVFDLRTDEPADPYAKAALATAFREMGRRLTRDSLPTVRDRRRVYYGYDSPSTSGQYRGGYFVPAGATIGPSASAREIFSVFLVNGNAAALPVTVALQDRGKALVVFEGDPRRQASGEFRHVEIGEGLTAVIRTTQQMLPDGRGGSLIPDETVAAAGDAALERAIELARAGRGSSVHRAELPSAAPVLREHSYPAMRYPQLEYRLLAAFRLWNVIDLFYPYRELLDRSWDDVLSEMIPVFAGARNEREYAEAVTLMSTRIQDSHAYAAGAAFTEHVIGTGLPPIRVRMIQDSLVVTALFDTAAARAAGVEVGDVLVTVDGTDAMLRYHEMSRKISVSTPQSGREKWTLQLMHGAPESVAELTLRDRAGRVKSASLARRHEDYRTLYHRERTGEVIRMLPGNIGYVDLDRLQPGMVDSMFALLSRTRAIVFDMRGYPQGTIYTLAPRFTDSARVVSILGTPMIGHGSPAARSVETFAQTVEAAPAHLRYRGRTVMLVDERTMSQAELTAMWMKVLNRTILVGGPTAGANGEITTVSLPGAMTVGFTGQSVVFPDGRRLQRIGLEPDILVRPTIAGVRAGRDEVLEAAIRALSIR